MAAAQLPKPQTVAIIAADAEFAQSAADGARSQIKKHGFNLVYDQSYPPSTTDFAPVIRAVQATNPDIVYIGAYPPEAFDTYASHATQSRTFVLSAGAAGLMLGAGGFFDTDRRSRGSRLEAGVVLL